VKEFVRILAITAPVNASPDVPGHQRKINEYGRRNQHQQKHLHHRK
jgi:hypothetical protein